MRIVGGAWRGRRLPVPDVEGLRPSGDRCRETLFNWLQPYLAGLRVIDLYAGTGVLGFEAVSRGAASATLVERSASAAATLRDSAAMLNANGVRVIEADALSWLAAQPENSMDLVFVDPPFGQGLAVRSLEALAASEALPPDGLVYVESPRSEPAPALPPHWDALRENVLGEVRMQLMKKAGGFTV